MPRKPVKFTRPPVVEVVCGVLFRDLPGLRVPHFGQFWTRVRADFPQPEERPPLAPLVESFDRPLATLMPSQMEWVVDVPIPRVWLLGDGGRRLLQLQRDRFLYNWKSTADDVGYPSYDLIIVEFEKWFAEFTSFVREEGIGDLEVRQFELTYVNHITKANGLDEVGEVGVFIDHLRAKTPKNRFLPQPANINWRTAYDLPERQGRLHLAAYSAFADQDRILRFDVIARGMSRDQGDSARRNWFALAHEWITQGFADVTSPKLHKIWGRTQ